MLPGWRKEINVHLIFLGLNRRNCTEKNIISLYRNKMVITDPQEILLDKVEYVKTLYFNYENLE